MHAAFAPYARWLVGCGIDAPPTVAQLRAWAKDVRLALPDGRPLTFACAGQAAAAIDYEASIARDGVVPIREGQWHDAFNALAWLALPSTKAALNSVHVRNARACTRNARSRARDAATLLDESGLLLACDDGRLPRLLRAQAWRQLFVDDADAVREHCRGIVLGHGLLDKLRSPFRAITAKVLVIAFAPGTLPVPGDFAAIDAQAALLVAGDAFLPATLAPLPVAALPGWDAERRGERLFDDVSVFRPKMLRSSS
jgi:hypothetical protein